MVLDKKLFSILVTGSNGQLAKELELLSEFSEHQFYFMSKNDLDITDISQIAKSVDNNHINIVINCAAYTKVDDAETNFLLANEINHHGVNKLVDVSRHRDVILMHISTDYVFDGKKREPYLETDITNPITAYGKTKLAGEYEIFNTDVKAIVIRTSWLYSNFGHNFVNSILRKGEKETSIDVVDDQIGTPNNAKDLAKAIIKIINHKKLYTAAESRELFHYNSIGSVSWYTFAKSIISNSNLDCFINPIKSKSLNLMAKRPKYSVLSNKKITKMFDLIIPHWEESLKDALKTNPILR